ncbi:unnamed protein product [Mesocestoides corti]|uniref:Ubiquitin-like protease family profile domain-containing protein n=1 Tax=Mesocestoides corti TaxID=53468 RepID=A0A3P6H3K3_MESCO|nr:unnamed protein product [Mesocestoides corti]
MANDHVYKCSSPMCSGFSYTPNVSCTVCGKLISAVPHIEIIQCNNEKTRVEQIGAKRRLVEKSDICVSGPSFSFPMVVISLGKMSVFDAREKPCTISNDSISFGAHVHGSWVPLSLDHKEVDDLLFCESLQVIFLRPKPKAFNRIYEALGISSNHSKDDKKKRIVIVLENESSRNVVNSLSASRCLTVPQLEIFCTSVRLVGGVCMPDLKPSVAQNLLVANGVRPSRGNSADTSSHDSGASETSTSPFEPHSENTNHTPPSSDCHQPSAVDSDNLVILSDDESDEKSSSPGSPSNTPADSEPNGSLSNSGKGSFVYHPPGSKDGIRLTDADVACLLPNCFLNDTIINFYLKYLFYEQLTTFQRHATHLFNCFFYSRLSSIPSGSTVSVSAGASDSQQAESLRKVRHANVANWTRRVDLFSKDYIIIPINESSHWFLGLVCYPWMTGMVSYTQLYENFAFDLCQLTPKFVDVDQLPVSSADIGLEELKVFPSDKKGDAFDRWRRRRLAWLRRRGINAMPCILLFDSIPSHSRVGNLHIIRNYLQAEWDARRSERDGVLTFNKDTIRGFSPKVPAQSNLVDCGIFLLHYVEMFFKKPVKSYTKVYFQNEMCSWFESEMLGQKRSVISKLIEQISRRTSARH